MRTSIASLVLFAATVSGASAQPTPQSDRAYFLIGQWRCQSAAGTLSNFTFVQNADGSLTGTNVLSSGEHAAVITAAGQARVFTERYTFDARNRTWTDSDTWNGIFAFDFSGQSGAWTGDDWEIVGRLRRNNSGGAGSPEHKTYTYLGPDRFRRKITSAVSGASSDSLCSRAGAATPEAR